jgi:Regulator of ribonuclease activity B
MQPKFNADFYLYFPAESDAHAASTTLRDEGYEVDMRLGADDVNWLALATMKIAREELEKVDARMAEVARAFRGDYDGYEMDVEPS